MGKTLTVETSAIDDADGLDNVAYSYQWLANGADITGATSSSYTLVDADKGKTIQVKVSFRDDRNNPETLTSAATAAVEPRPNSSGHRSAHHQRDGPGGRDPDGGNLGHRRRRRDERCGVQLPVAGRTMRTSPGATSDTYTLVDADLDKAVKVRVIFTDNADNQETLTSEATVSVEPKANSPATGAPTISGTAQVGETLTASTSGIRRRRRG